MDAEIIQRLAKLPTGNISDAMGKKGSMDCNIKPVFPEARMGGPAVTVQGVPGDNLAAHLGLDQAPAGSVLVIDARGYTNAGLFGEIMSLAAQKKGLAGVVIDGACRDCLAIKELGFPLFSRAINPGGTVKEAVGEVNVLIDCGGVAIHPGDIVVGDADGVVVIPQDSAEEVLKKAEAINVKEKIVMERVRQGETLMQIFEFDKLIEKKKS